VEFDAIGGMQSQIHDTTLALSALGVEQTILTLAIPGAPRIWAMDSRTRAIGVRMPILPLRSRIRGMVDLNLSWMLGALRHIAREGVRCDLVHCHFSGVYEPPMLARLLRWRTRLPLVLTIHCSSLATYHPLSYFDRAQHRLARWSERNALRLADRIIVLTDRVRAVVEDHVPGAADRMRVIPDSIDAAAFAARAPPQAVAKFRKRFRLQQGQKTIGYVGRVAREKNWRALLELDRLLANQPVHFLVVGDGNERDLLERQIRIRGREARFTVTGYQPRDAIPAALAACDVLVLPSRHEEFGSILIEAMAIGTPAVAFATGGVPSVLNHGKAGILVPDGDLEAMTSSILKVIHNPELSRGLKSAGRCWVYQEFGLAQAASRLLHTYRELGNWDVPHR